MNVQEARAQARGWLEDNAPLLEGFVGAYLTGSTAWASPQAEFRRGSDIDLFIVLVGPNLPERPGIIVRNGVVLEINFVTFEAISNPSEILGHYHLAGAFVSNGLLSDPTSKLASVRQAVAEKFSDPVEITRRYLDAKTRATSLVGQYRQSTQLHDKATNLFFAAGVCTHVILVADQKNPTIRRRYVEARKSLEHMDRLDFNDQLLRTLGSTGWDQEIATQLLADVAVSFDMACPVMRTPVWFSSDMTPAAREIAIEGSAEMIDAGFHREAAFWLVAVSARSRAIVAQDGTDAQLADTDKKMLRLLTHLGVSDDKAMNERARQVEADIGECWGVCMDYLHPVA